MGRVFCYCPPFVHLLQKYGPGSGGQMVDRCVTLRAIDIELHEILLLPPGL